MKIHLGLRPFDGAKFAARYGLDPHRDFFIDGEGFLVYPDAVGPSPIFEPSDTAAQDRRAALKAKIKSRTATLPEIMEYIEP